MNPRRREFLARTLLEVRDPAEGLLPTESYVTLLEAFMATRENAGRGFSEDEFFGVVEWADLAALRSQWLEGLVSGTMGIDVVDGGPALTEPPPAEVLARAVARDLEADDEDLAITAAVRVFVAGRDVAHQPVSAMDLALVRTWCAAAAADRALFDLALGYPNLGLDLLPDGRVTLVGAGQPV